MKLDEVGMKISVTKDMNPRLKSAKITLGILLTNLGISTRAKKQGK
jgi:hypothetical protein